MTDRFNELLTEYYFCSLDYMRSPASCTQEYVRYSSVCGQAESDYLSAVQEVLNSAYGSVLAGLLGEGQAQSLLSTSPIRGRSWPCWSVRLLWSTNTGRRWSRSPLSSPAAGPGPVPRRRRLSGGLTGGGCYLTLVGGAGRRPQWGPSPLSTWSW